MQVQWEVAISASHGFVSLNQSEGALVPRPNPNPNPNPNPKPSANPNPQPLP